MFANLELQRLRTWDHEGLTETMPLKFKEEQDQEKTQAFIKRICNSSLVHRSVEFKD